MRRVIIDTDAGVDDALAIMLALRSPELHVEAITTVGGNMTVDLCTRNVLLVLQELGAERQPVVARGEAKPIVRDLLTAPEVHGRDGIGNITTLEDESGARKYPEPRPLYSTEDAPQLIARLARELGQELEIITLGPLTNLARAIETDRQAMLVLRQITIMGGAFRQYGNTSLAAEFNVYLDPEAAGAVLGLDVPKTLIPLDVTEQVILPREMLASRLREHPTDDLRFACDVSAFYMDYHLKHLGINGCFVHDPLTIAAAIDPSLLDRRETFVIVETKGEFTSGMTLAELRPERRPTRTNASAAVSADSQRFLALFLDRLSSSTS